MYKNISELVNGLIETSNSLLNTDSYFFAMSDRPIAPKAYYTKAEDIRSKEGQFGLLIVISAVKAYLSIDGSKKEFSEHGQIVNLEECIKTFEKVALKNW